MEITIPVSEEMQRKLEGLAQESGLSVADCAHDMLEGNLERLHLYAWSEPSAYEKALARFTNRTPEQIFAAQCRALAQLPPPRRTPPPGKTLEDMVSGKWPGTETDEEIIAALKELS